MRTALLLVLAGCAPHLKTAGGGVDSDWVAPENSWPLEAPLPVGDAGVGFAIGAHVPDIRIPDQHGAEVSLWQFAGRVTLLDVSTMWCAPCQELARGTEHTIETFADRDFTYATVLQENVESRHPETEDLNRWADLFGIVGGPVLADGDKTTAGAVLADSYPAVLVIGPDLRVVERVNPTTEPEVQAAILRALTAYGE